MENINITTQNNATAGAIKPCRLKDDKGRVFKIEVTDLHTIVIIGRRAYLFDKMTGNFESMSTTDDYDNIKKSRKNG